MRLDTRHRSPKSHPKYPVLLLLNEVFGGYFGFAELMLYGFLWSELLHDHSMYIDNVTLIGEDAEIWQTAG